MPSGNDSCKTINIIIAVEPEELGVKNKLEGLWMLDIEPGNPEVFNEIKQLLSFRYGSSKKTMIDFWLDRMSLMSPRYTQVLA